MKVLINKRTYHLGDNSWFKIHFFGRKFHSNYVIFTIRLFRYSLIFTTYPFNNNPQKK